MNSLEPAPIPFHWELDSQIRLRFSTRKDGNLKDPSRCHAWVSAMFTGRKIVIPRQRHGNLVVDAECADFAELDEADGVVSTQRNTILGVYGADCPGLCIVSGEVLGMAHCGWRGVSAGIVHNLVQAIGERTKRPTSTWIGFIGPGISGSQYQVDHAVLNAFAWPPEALSMQHQGKANLDLPTTIASLLKIQGLRDIRQSGICTNLDPRLHSYRHNGPGLTHLLLAWRI